MQSITLWDKEPDNWNCPCCSRSKSALIRQTKNNERIGHLHEHHDHILDYPNHLLKEQFEADWNKVLESKYPGADHFRSGLCRFVQRFPNEVICQDCNVAEGAAKQKIAADRFFSFAPPEIAQIIIATPNEKHGIKNLVAANIWKTRQE